MASAVLSRENAQLIEENDALRAQVRLLEIQVAGLQAEKRPDFFDNRGSGFGVTGVDSITEANADKIPRHPASKTEQKRCYTHPVHGLHEVHS